MAIVSRTRNLILSPVLYNQRCFFIGRSDKTGSGLGSRGVAGFVFAVFVTAVFSEESKVRFRHQLFMSAYL